MSMDLVPMALLRDSGYAFRNLELNLAQNYS